jgi:SAM-dependent methyltransferase
VSFIASGPQYFRFMGRWSRELAPPFIEFAGVEPAMRVLDVGCGPGALTAPLAGRLGAERVAAIDPSEPFVTAIRERLSDVDVRTGVAEELPFDNGRFDAALAQLVVNFMQDAPAGVGEMRRVVRPGGVVAAAVWGYEDGMEMLRAFWDAASEIDRDAPDEGSVMRYRTAAELDELWRETGLESVEVDALVVEQTYAAFDELWEPFTFGIGPAGAWVATLDDDRRAELREALHRRLGSPDGAFTLSAKAWAARGRVPG